MSNIVLSNSSQIYSAGSTSGNSIWGTNTYGSLGIQSAVHWYSGYPNYTVTPDCLSNDTPQQIFVYTYNSLSATTCNIYAGFDNTGWFYLNNTLTTIAINSWGNTYSYTTVNLIAGSNIFYFVLTNGYSGDYPTLNPSAFNCLVTKSSGTQIFSTNSTFTGWSVYINGNYYFKTGYSYKGIDLGKILYGQKINNTSGYKSFPGANVNIQNNIQTINTLGFNISANTQITSNKIPYFVEHYNNATLTLPSGINYISVVMIGATGGGGGGGDCSTYKSGNIFVNITGGGGGAPGKPLIVLTNKIPYSMLTNVYNITIGNGGAGGAGGIWLGDNALNVFVGNAGNATTFSCLQNIIVNSSNGGGKGVTVYTGAVYNSNTVGTNTAGTTGSVTSSINTYLINNYNNLVYDQQNPNNGQSVGNATAAFAVSGYASGNAGTLSTNIPNIQTTLGITDTNHDVTVSGGKGGYSLWNGTATGVNGTPGTNGANGYVRVYYFYN